MRHLNPKLGVLFLLLFSLIVSSCGKFSVLPSPSSFAEKKFKALLIDYNIKSFVNGVYLDDASDKNAYKEDLINRLENYTQSLKNDKFDNNHYIVSVEAVEGTPTGDMYSVLLKITYNDSKTDFKQALIKKINFISYKIYDQTLFSSTDSKQDTGSTVFEVTRFGVGPILLGMDVSQIPEEVEDLYDTKIIKDDNCSFYYKGEFCLSLYFNKENKVRCISVLEDLSKRIITNSGIYVNMPKSELIKIPNIQIADIEFIKKDNPDWVENWGEGIFISDGIDIHCYRHDETNLPVVDMLFIPSIQIPASENTPTENISSKYNEDVDKYEIKDMSQTKENDDSKIKVANIKPGEHIITSNGVGPIKLGMSMHSVPNSVKGLYNRKNESETYYGDLICKCYSGDGSEVMEIFDDGYGKVGRIWIWKRGLRVGNSYVTIGMPKEQFLSTAGVKKYSDNNGTYYRLGNYRCRISLDTDRYGNQIVHQIIVE